MFRFRPCVIYVTINMKYQIFRKFRTVLLEKQVRIRISVGETTAFNFSAIDRDAVTKIREKTLVT